jgi:hypothetical protein
MLRAILVNRKRRPSRLVMTTLDPLQVALALAILRRRAVATSMAASSLASASTLSATSDAERRELSYLRQRAAMQQDAALVEFALLPGGHSLLPHGARALVAWLEQRDGTPSAIMSTGFALLDELCLSSDGRCLCSDGTSRGVCEVLARVLRAEASTVRAETSSLGPQESVAFAHRLCGAAVGSMPASTNPSWLCAVQRLLVQIVSARGAPALGVLARGTLELVLAIRDDATRLEPRLLGGVQPVLGALQQVLEHAAAAAAAPSPAVVMKRGRASMRSKQLVAWTESTHRESICGLLLQQPDGEWREPLTQAFECTLDAQMNNLPLLALCVWNLMGLANRIPTCIDADTHGD